MPITLRAEDTCGCNSGLRYGDCHMPVHEAPEGQALEVAHRIYVREWARNADAYGQQGLYAALAAELAACGNIRHVLDLGCGLGHGLEAMRLALREDGLALVGVDENPACLAAASERLGIPAPDGNINRLVDRVLPDGRYRSLPGPGTIATQPEITLLQADLLVADETFAQWLGAHGSFDAVTLWFSGVHKARSQMELATVFDIRSDADHRELVEDVTLEISERLLRPGGILHIVGRGGFRDGLDARRGFAEPYSEVIQGTAFKLKSVVPHRYSEPGGNGSVLVRSHDQTINALPNFAVSMLFEKMDAPRDRSAP